MKVSTSASLSFLCFLLVVTETAAWSMGSIFGNLMFAVHGCMNKQYESQQCMPTQYGPAKNKYFWDNVCSSSNSTITYWTEVACDKQRGKDRSMCVEYAVSSCPDDGTEVDSSESAEYSTYDAGSTGENSISAGGTASSSRMSFLPYIIVATVATMFLGLFVWKKRRDQQSKEVDELLADDSFHGSIAKRISNKLSTKKSAQVSETEFVKTTGYALA